MPHNPLIHMDQYTDIELENKVIELQRKYFQTHNADLQMQIANTLDIFKDELRTRRAIAAQKQREQMQENGESDLDSLINIS